MSAFKAIARSILPVKVYLWAANQWRAVRRLFIYPDTAHVGPVDYDAYWDAKAQSGLGQLSPWRKKRAQVFADLVCDGDRVLDVGVGDGALLRYILDQKKIEAYGLDVSPKVVDFCRQQGLNVDVVDVNRPIGEYLKEQFDFVILSEIVEHLPDPESLLDSLRPYVRQAVFVSIPNTGYYQHRLRLLLGKFPLQWVVTPGEHLRFWTRTDFHWWVRQIDFKIAREIPYEGTPGLKDVWPGLFAAGIVYMIRSVRQVG